jgi:hypothetical protein
MVLDVPSDRPWQDYGGIDFLIDAYDWDRIIVSSDHAATLYTPITLCTGLFPCQLELRGIASATLVENSLSAASSFSIAANRGRSDVRRGQMQIAANGSIICLKSAGCTGVSMQSLHVMCTTSDSGGGGNSMAVSDSPVLEVGGTVVATVWDTAFVRCSSTTDGSSIQAYGGASVTIRGCSFVQSRSQGVGGAISAMGASLLIDNSSFINCSAARGGGAVATDDFHCYGSRQRLQISSVTAVEITACHFEGCSASGPGGAVLFMSSNSAVTLSHSSFVSCTSAGPGGAVSASRLAAVSVVKCLLNGNSAGWPGGGALHSDGARLTLHGVSCAGNSAPVGGGGALFWEGEIHPTILAWCDPGLYPDLGYTCTPNDCTARCIPCAVGRYQSSEGAANGNACIPCAAGTYSSFVGATACVECSAGHFSLTVGANRSAECTLCAAGKHASSSGTSLCNVCSPGTFSSAAGASSCDICEVGFYGASYGNSACFACEPGFYSGIGAVNCEICHAGSYLPGGAQECVLCAAGSFSTSEGAVSETTCIPCEPGSYSEAVGVSGCELCQAGTYSSLVGANSSSACTGCSESKLSFSGSSLCINATDIREGTPLEMSGTTESVAVVLPFNMSIFNSVFSRLTCIASPDILLQLVFSSPTAADIHTIDIKMDGIPDMFYPPWMLPACGRTSTFLEWKAEDVITLQWTNWEPNPPVWISPPCFFRTAQISLFSNSTITICYRLISSADPTWERETLSIGIYGDNTSFSLSRITLNGLCLVLSPEFGSYNISTRPWLATEVLIPACAAGQYLSADVSCSNCPTGTFQSSNGFLSKTACTVCAAGKYSSAAGASGPDSCIMCTNSTELNETSVDSSELNETLARTTACEPVEATRFDDPLRIGKQSSGNLQGGIDFTSGSVYHKLKILEEKAR